MSERSPYQHSRQRFGELLSRRRRALGLSQQELAERLQMDSAESISRYERGLRDPRLNTLLRLAAALDLDLSELLAPFDDELRSIRIAQREDPQMQPTTDDLRDLVPGIRATQNFERKLLELGDQLQDLPTSERSNLREILLMLARLV